jgi:hypothetical protein
LETTTVPNAIKPIFLFADSQLLFWRDETGARFMDRARALIDADELGRPPRGAYLGASNGDVPEFFDLFHAAMAELGIQECRHVPAEPSPEDLEFLDDADLILLAGGDVWLGWTAFEKTGIKDKLMARYYAGAVLIGISAGAIQLGLKGWDEEDGTVFDCLRLVPFVVDAHDEPSWSGLVRALPKAGEHARGFGIPSGGGALYHPDYSVEPVRHPLTEFELTESGSRQALVFPGSTTEVKPDEAGPRVMSQEELLDRVMGELGPPDPEDSVN